MRNTELQGSWIQCLFSKIRGVGSFLGPVSSPSMSLLARLTLPDICFSSFEAVLKPNEKTVGYIHNIHDIAAPMGTAYHSNHYCNSVFTA